MKTTISIFILLFSSATLLAQISGTVADELEQPIPGVNIYIEGSYDGSSTNENGEFEFKTKLKGKQFIVASFIGYQTHKQEISINDQAIQINIILIPENTKLEAIEITAGSFSAGDKYKSVALKPFDIATTASAEGDIYGAMATLPGAQKVGEEGMLFVRGGESYETKTYMDGLLIQNPYFSKMPNLPTRGRFSPLLFNGTVFSTGAYSAEFGQALSSVLLLNTNALAPKTETNIMLLSVGGSFSHAHKWENSSVSFNAEYQNLTPYFAIAKQNIDWLKIPENTGSTLAFRQKTSKTGIIKVFGAFSKNSSSLLYPNLDSNSNDTISLANTDYYINSSFNEMLSENLMIKAGVSYNYNIEPMGINNNEIETITEGFATRIGFENSVSDKLTLKYGGSFSTIDFTEKIQMNELESDFISGYRNNIYAAFMESEIQLSNKFAFRAGLRNEFIEIESKNYLSPRVSLAYKLNETNQFSAAYGIFNQTAFKNYLKVNNSLASEISNHYILNYQYIKNDRVFRAEIYYKDYDNLVKYSNLYSYTPENFNNKGFGSSKGIDIFWRDNKSIKNGDYWISYSYNDTKRDYKDYPGLSTPTFASKHNFSAVYKQFIQKIKALCGVTYTYSSGRPYFNPNNAEFHADYTKGYHNLSGNLTYIINAKKGNMKMIHFTVNNILGFDNIFSHRYSSSPNEQGTYASLPVKQASKRFFVIGFIWTIQ